MPSDIQVLINNNDLGTAMLRIVEVIGQDNLKILMQKQCILLLVH